MRPWEFILMDIIFISLRVPGYSDNRLTQQYQNPPAHNAALLGDVVGTGWHEWFGRWILLRLIVLSGHSDTVICAFLMVVRGCLRSSSLLPIRAVTALKPPAWGTGRPPDTSIIYCMCLQNVDKVKCTGTVYIPGWIIHAAVSRMCLVVWKFRSTTHKQSKCPDISNIHRAEMCWTNRTALTPCEEGELVKEVVVMRGQLVMARRDEDCAPEIVSLSEQ